MTHAYFKHHDICWEDCVMLRFASNNGVVLKHNGSVIVFLDGEHLGLSKTDSDEIAFKRAEPIFKMAISLSNTAAETSFRHGAAAKLKSIQGALGI